jgi:hypothetical protein
MDPAMRTTTVSQGRRVLWTMPGWFRVAALADDGAHLVVGHEGMNLLPLDAGASTVIVTFYRRGDVVRKVTLAQVMGDLSNLERSVSHLVWGYYLGFDAQGHYAIETVEGRRLAFDVTTGRLVEAR